VRRAITLLLMSVLVPGSAHLASCRRTVGALALRIWVVCWVLVALVGLAWLATGPTLIGWLTFPPVLKALAVVLGVLALCWPWLVADAWRLGNPEALPRPARPWIAGMTVILMVVTGVPLGWGAQRIWSAADLIRGVFLGQAVSDAASGRFNVLLMGADAGADRMGLRPDSMTVASIDVATGRTVLFSLPRNLEEVPFPPGTAAAAAMPRGWSCGDKCLLNAIYTWAVAHPQYFPGAEDPGAEAMKEAAQAVTGLKINYYALIDLQGFRFLVDAVGGISVNVRERVPIGGETSPISGYIEPGRQRLNGFHALWFARSRAATNDYDRMARQRCVMTAMLHQLDPQTVLFRFNEIAAAGKQIVRTDIPSTELGTFVQLALSAKSQKMTSVQFVPPLINPAYPDYTVIRSTVKKAIVDSEGRPTSTPAQGKGPGNGAEKSAAGRTVVPTSAVVDAAGACSA